MNNMWQIFDEVSIELNKVQTEMNRCHLFNFLKQIKMY